MVYILKRAKNESEILRVFQEEKSPLHAMVRLHEYSLTWLISQLYNNQQGRPLQLLPFQSILMNMLWEKKFPLVLMSRGGGKSFLLAVYALTRALLCPGSEIIIVGAGLRQSMKVFNYVQKLYTQSPLVQQALGVYGGPKITTSGPYINVGNLSKITALPIGDGEKIRGQRATNILCIDKDTIIETKNGLIRIKDSFDNDSLDNAVYTGFGKFENPKNFIKTQPVDSYRVKTTMGYQIICSDLHRLYTQDGWKNILHLEKGDKIPFKNQFVFPDKDYVEYDDVIVNEDLAWLMGVMVSEGCVSGKHEISITNTNKKLIDDTAKCFDSIGLKYNIYNRPPYIDKRGWKNRECWEIKSCNLKFREKLVKLGLERNTARFKSIPWSVLYSKKSVVVSFLQGLFIGDGSAFLYKDKKRDNNFGIAYYTASEQLSIDLQVLLHKFDIFCSRGSRKSRLSKHSQYTLRFYGRNTHLIYNLLNIDKWEKIYQSSYKNGKFIRPYDNLSIVSIEKLEGKRILYDYTLPINKSFIGNSFINHNCDEFATLSESIFETVIRPFAAVHADPEERVRVAEFCDRLCDLGADDSLIDQINSLQGYGNQVVLSGTASYEFNHFYKYHQSYEMVIESKGDPKKIQKAMERRSKTDMQSQFSTMKADEIKTLAAGWKNYAIYKLPYDGIPKGFLDAENVANDKATFSPIRFGMEYSMLFAKDSDGFIKRSLINDATLAEKPFSIELYGDPGSEYVMGLDPARHNDNFGCVVLKLIPGGSQVVYVDAWRKKDSPVSVKKVRDIMRRFNIVYIALDKGGGGEGFRESIGLRELCEEEDIPILPLRDQIDDKRLLGEQAQFILDMVNWTSSWISVNAHALHGDLEHLRVIFPQFPVMEQICDQYAARVLKHDRKTTIEEHKSLDIMVFGKDNDALEKIEEGVWDNLQAMIDETCAIERTVTPGGVEQFELPKLIEQREGLDVRRRDRFSALVLAAYAARVYRAEARNKKEIKSGGSPNSILKRSAKRRRHIQRFGNVMY